MPTNINFSVGYKNKEFLHLKSFKYIFRIFPDDQLKGTKSGVEAEVFLYNETETERRLCHMALSSKVTYKAEI